MLNEYFLHMRPVTVITSCMLLLTACGPLDINLGTDSCGPANCGGCCNASGICVAGNAMTECGVGGFQCNTCGGTAGVCLVDGSCGLDPNQKLRLRVSAAEITASNNGAAWDGDNSAPDARVRIACPGTDPSASVSQGEATDTYFPVWTSGGCVTTAGELFAAGFSVTFDEIDVLSDDSITPVLGYTVPFESVALAESMGIASFFGGPTAGLVSVEFTLEAVR